MQAYQQGARTSGPFKKCCITRNDMHLREFVVRNLFAGFGHIVIYDNNQVESGINYDVRGMLAPFVAQGAVPLVSWR